MIVTAACSTLTFSATLSAGTILPTLTAFNQGFEIGAGSIHALHNDSAAFPARSAGTTDTAFPTLSAGSAFGVGFVSKPTKIIMPIGTMTPSASIPTGLARTTRASDSATGAK